MYIMWHVLPTLHNAVDEERSRLHCGRSLISCTALALLFICIRMKRTENTDKIFKFIYFQLYLIMTHKSSYKPFLYCWQEGDRWVCGCCSLLLQMQQQCGDPPSCQLFALNLWFVECDAILCGPI